MFERGFEVLYGNVDSLFVKRSGATREEYELLARTIQRETGLPIVVDNLYRFIVFLRQETRPDVECMNHFFGKLTSGGFNCRGIELRRRDCPAFLKEFQRRLMEILFDAETGREVVEVQVAKAATYARDTYNRVIGRSVDPSELAISKHVRKDTNAYRSMFPNVIAARHLARGEKRLEEYGTVSFVYMNSDHSNPMRRVLPSVMMSGASNYYDREKYGRLVLDVGDTVLKSFKTDSSPCLTTLDSYYGDGSV